MLFHEIPHEVGDFAVLFKLKVPLYKVLFFQLLTGCGAMIGAFVSTKIGEDFKNECLAITSGGFLYFSINCLMNELKEVKSVFSLIICTGSFFFGLYFMFIFALFE
jgi:zinc transporter ZupT